MRVWNNLELVICKKMTYSTFSCDLKNRIYNSTKKTIKFSMQPCMNEMNVNIPMLSLSGHNRVLNDLLLIVLYVTFT